LTAQDSLNMMIESPLPLHCHMKLDQP